MNPKPSSTKMTDREKQALARVRRAGVVAPESVMLCWVRSIGAESVLTAKLSEIRAIANAF